MELLQLTTSGISLAHSITENTMPSDTLKKKQNGQNHLEFLEFYINWLVVDLPLKNMKVNGKDDPI
jgi:hypothetical protein